MSDKDILQEAFAPLGQAPKGPNYSHPQNDEIIRDALALLHTISEGRKLIPLIKSLDIAIRVVIGKQPGFFVPDGHTITLISPKSLVGINPFETACNLGLGIKEIQLNLVNIQRVNSDPSIISYKLVDIVIEMCEIVSEFQEVHNHLKLVDLMEKLGHGNVYKMYKAKASYQEIADLILKE